MGYSPKFTLPRFGEQSLIPYFGKQNLTPQIWGIRYYFINNIEEILDMPTLSEIQMNLTNSVCEGQNELYKEDINTAREAEEEKIQYEFCYCKHKHFFV